MVDHIDVSIGGFGSAMHVQKQAEEATRPSAEVAALLGRATTEYLALVDDLLAGFGHLFSEMGKGGYFAEMREHPERYLYKRPKVRRWLMSLRRRAVVLVLATNSHIDYTHLLMSHAFGAHWQELFDIVVVDSRKPGFFKGNAPFVGNQT
jgi:hypothetical protein